MRPKENATDKILAILKQDTFLSTNEIASKAEIHWYLAFGYLNELFTKDAVQKIQTNHGFFWRLKQEGGR